MREIAAVAGAAASVAIVLWAGPGLAQQARTTLPALDVTAPRAAPQPFEPPTTGMLGKVRVEEDKWPEIPCGTAQISAATTGKCQNGPMLMSAMSYGGVGNVPNAYGACTIRHQLISVDVGRFAVEADVQVFDPYKVTGDLYNGLCTVWSGYEHMPEDFKDMNQVTRRGGNWRNFVPGNGRSGAQSTIEFSEGSRSCVAVERLGPPWHGGFVWVLRATICQAGAAPIVPADVDTALSAVQIHVYDPDGNLRPPPGG